MPQAAITDRSPHSPPYQRHRPEQTLLYQIIERHYPEFRDVMAMQGKSLPLHVQQEFDDYLISARLLCATLNYRVSTGFCASPWVMKNRRLRCL
jgi:hypothetical protein